MAERGLTSCGARAVLGLAMLVQLSCAVGTVLLAVTESVWWPVAAGRGRGLVGCRGRRGDPGRGGHDVRIESAARGADADGFGCSSSSCVK